MVCPPAADRPCQPASLVPVKRVQTVAIPMACRSAFHLNHKKPSVFLKHQIQLTPSTAPVSIQNPPASLPKLFQGHGFRELPLILCPAHLVYADSSESFPCCNSTSAHRSGGGHRLQPVLSIVCHFSMAL